MTTFGNMKKIAGAAAVAVVMGATAFSAAPAQAQDFHFGVGGGSSGPNFSFGIGDGRDHGRPGRRCLSDRELRGEIGRQGYRVFDIRDGRRGTVEARASRGGSTYRLIVDQCSGDILDRERTRR